MDKRGLRRDKPMGIFGSFSAMIFTTVLIALGLLLASAWVTFSLLSRSAEVQIENIDRATTDELKQVFEAFGMQSEIMPDIYPIYQSVEGSLARVEILNLLRGVPVDEGFAGQRVGRIAVAVQLKVTNFSLQPVPVSDLVFILADSFRGETTNTSASFLREYEMTNLNSALVAGGDVLEGFVTFYIREQSLSDTFLQINANGAGALTNVRVL